MNTANHVLLWLKQKVSLVSLRLFRQDIQAHHIEIQIGFHAQLRPPKNCHRVVARWRNVWDYMSIRNLQLLCICLKVKRTCSPVLPPGVSMNPGLKEVVEVRKTDEICYVKMVFPFWKRVSQIDYMAQLLPRAGTRIISVGPYVLRPCGIPSIYMIQFIIYC